jgi:steroid delta-isomerase-like uncharacterized protein
MMSAVEILNTYYAAFQKEDHETMLSLLDPDVIHDINQGGSEQGIEAFRAFLLRMKKCYHEQLENIVIMTSADGTRAAAEFVVHGSYLVADEGLPPAHGQNYILPAGAFFQIAHEKITRVSVYYNLPEWLRQVS